MASPPNKSESKKDSLKPSKDTDNSKLTIKEIREEYFNQLRSWLNTVNSYQCYYNKLQRESFQNNYQQVLKNPNEVPKVVPNVVRETPAVERNQFVGIRCQIPSLWKRFGAEFIDFLLLSLVKFLIAYFIVDSILEIDFTKYNSIFTRDDYNVDYTTAVEMTSELFFIEVTHRIIVCVYEIYCLQGSTIFQGGATVGKTLLDLTVVRADKLFNIRGQPTDVIALIPGGDIGWKRAALRSITKNLFFAFLFPLPFITAAANQNRCAYDVLCGTMVVEVIQPLRCEQSELIPIG
ncbi:protein FAM8A1-like [Metopolophium dirhodum]|uniref:protein FAM8A1-like n=1 Tax=Metopolophium dirhodum TaxID=44670 RepID=UPI0029902E98|nr:protein FAM8A1-like [Metopolophium dirhodum]XP_060868834.1 protein FAM8A1-like [Metopolophium dirhodum]XP_060868835.1 protein FAM8A1-like [Metopolophium dirhodum]